MVDGRLTDRESARRPSVARRLSTVDGQTVSFGGKRDRCGFIDVLGV